MEAQNKLHKKNSGSLASTAACKHNIRRTTLQALQAPGAQELEAAQDPPVGAYAVKLVVQVLHPCVDVRIRWRLGHPLDLERLAALRKQLRCRCTYIPSLLLKPRARTDMI